MADALAARRAPPRPDVGRGGRRARRRRPRAHAARRRAARRWLGARARRVRGCAAPIRAAPAADGAPGGGDRCRRGA
eukprot:3809696-Prymnesium_polylepis.1